MAKLSADQSMGIVGGGVQLADSIVTGLNPIGRYGSTNYMPTNDVNALFQQGLNTDVMANRYNYGKTIGSTTMAGASIGTSIMPGIGTAIGAAGGAIVGGITSIFGNENMQRKTRAANERTAGNFNRSNQQLQANEMFNARLNPMNYAAYGGIYANGGLMEVNTGGKHESNPYGGVPFSSTNGVTNSAEQGETITKVGNSNRVYTDRIKLTKGIVKMVGLDESLIGKTPAEATKIMNKKFMTDKVAGKDALLPMDKIRRNGLLPKLDDIFMAQEVMKEKKGISNNTEQKAMGGVTLRNTKNRFFVLNNTMNPFADGGNTKYKKWYNRFNIYDKAEADSINKARFIEAKNKYYGSLNSGDSDSIRNTTEEYYRYMPREQYNKEWHYKLDSTIGGNIAKFLDPSGITSWSDVKKAWNDGKFDYNDILQPLGAIPIIGKVGKLIKGAELGVKTINLGQDISKNIKFSKGGSTTNSSKQNQSIQDFASQVLAHKENYSTNMIRKANFAKNASHFKHGDGDEVNPFEPQYSTPENPIFYKEPITGSPTKNQGDYTNWMKYAPVLGNAIQGLELAFEKPEIAKMERVSLPSKGTNAQMKYINTQPYMQQLEKSQATTASQIRESSGGNRAQYMANVAGSDLGYADKYGTIRSQIDDNNWQRYLNVLSSNNQLNAQYNQQLLGAQQLNAGLAFQEADVNSRNRAALSNARRGASQSLFANLGAIGQERENADIISKYFGYNPLTAKRTK